MTSAEKIEFCASLPADMRPLVESLFFFNERQARLHDRIHTVIAILGMPEVVERNGRIWIEIPPDKTQCLFACAAGDQPPRPVGVVLYSRPADDTIWITHIAIDPDYALGGTKAALAIARQLIDRVTAIARSISGVDLLRLPYRNQIYLRVRGFEATPGKSTVA